MGSTQSTWEGRAPAALLLESCGRQETSAPRLADDVQELCLAAGKWSQGRDTTRFSGDQKWQQVKDEQVRRKRLLAKHSQTSIWQESLKKQFSMCSLPELFSFHI